jgi:hypothetical protein
LLDSWVSPDRALVLLDLSKLVFYNFLSCRHRSKQ